MINELHAIDGLKSMPKCISYILPHARKLVCLWMVALLVIFFLSCERKVMQKDTITRRGVVYLKGEKEAFSGIVIGKGRDGYRSEYLTFEKTYVNGLLHGVTRYWYENGKLESKENYVEGELHGLTTRYYPNGKPKARIHFENGLRGGGRGEMFWDNKGRKIKR